MDIIKLNHSMYTSGFAPFFVKQFGGFCLFSIIGIYFQLFCLVIIYKTNSQIIPNYTICRKKVLIFIDCPAVYTTKICKKQVSFNEKNIN